MALDGIGGGSPLERFQAIRDSAKKKIEGAAKGPGGQASLTDLINLKRTQMNGLGGTSGKMEAGGGASSPVSGNAAKASAERIRPGLGAANGALGAANGALGAANGALGAANGALGAAIRAFGSAVNGSPGNAASAAAQALSGPTGYGRAGALQKQESRPTLGRHVDFMA